MPSRPVVLAVLFAAAALPAAFTLDPKFDHDTWWHLRVGQLVAETGTVPDADPFSHLGRERPTPWVAYSWLYEWGLYQAFAAFGPAGILWTRTLLGAASTAAVLALMSDRGWRLVPAALLAGVVMMPLMKERPWHLTVVFTVLTAGVVTTVRGGSPASRSWWLVPLFALWANIHVQFVLGWLVLGLACVFPGRANRRSLLLLTAGCVAATLCNPYFARLHVVIWEYATQTGPLRSVQELAPPDPSSPWFWAGLALLGWAGGAAVRRRPIDWFEVALIALALAFTLRMRRDVWLAAVAAGVVLRRMIPESIASSSSGPLPPWGGGLGWGVRGVNQPVTWPPTRGATPHPNPPPQGGREPSQAGSDFARTDLTSTPLTPLPKSAAVGVAVVAFVVIRLLNLTGLGPPSDTAAANERAYPVRAAAFVRDRELPGPLFNSFDWGGYLIWALPEHPVSIDGRTNLYGSARVTRAMNTWAGGPGWDADPELASAKLVIAPRALPLTRLLRERSTEWVAAFEDETAVVFVAVGR